jgi:hypothetical protein
LADFIAAIQPIPAYLCSHSGDLLGVEPMAEFLAARWMD